MKNLAQSRTHIKRRVDRYLWSDESVSLQRLRYILSENFVNKAPTLVLGGLIRDLAHGGVRAFKSDVDLVVDAPNERVIRLATNLNATANRFGGFSTTIGSWKIDFWALKNTWAHREGHVRIRTKEDITKCTFFTSDAIAYSLNDRTLYARPEYLRDARSNVLEINLLPNPSPYGNLVRAIRRLLSADMSAGPRLKQFIIDNLNSEAYSYVLATELRLYSHSFAGTYGTVDALVDALIFRSARVPVMAHQRHQLAFAV